MIEDILPAGVRFAEAFEDSEAPGWFPEEEALMVRAVPKRRAEFGTVRRCARAALASLGVPPAPLLPGRRGEPHWPGGTVGSMTHCAGYRGAVVARSTEFLSLGIDAEPDEPLPEGVLAMVSLPEERDRLARQAADGEAAAVHADRLLFSAKEAVFKAWYPLTRRELDFTEAWITFSNTTARTGTFDARLLVAGPELGGNRLGGFKGRWRAGQGLVLTAITVAVGAAALPGPGYPDGPDAGTAPDRCGTPAPAPASAPPPVRSGATGAGGTSALPRGPWSADVRDESRSPATRLRAAGPLPGSRTEGATPSPGREQS